MAFSSFGIMQVLFFVVFFAVFVIFLITIIKNISTWKKNNNSPRLTVEATIVSKRADVTHYHHNNANGVGGHSASSTSYYVTFQVASGDRMELLVGNYDYGMLVEGDRGMLAFQGTRFLGFERR